MRDEPLAVTAKNGQHEGTTILVLQGPLTLPNTFDLQRDLAEHKPPVYDKAGLSLITSSIRRFPPDCLDPKSIEMSGVRDLREKLHRGQRISVPDRSHSQKARRERLAQR